ncbi:MAG: mannose-1-phosphate guanylyltransferase/mannose-6-phosphate isomerase [Spirochaetales bacterium]|nr:mannose-1-phosphate guanylyltransferase/mannose-6-phosphate isomerase [Spirochaetales bacterium]
MNTKFLILAGGSGSRLWPLSRKLYAKQFLQLTDDKSLLQNTITRLCERFNANDIYILTNNDSKFIAASQMMTLNNDFPAEHILVEPTSRNTFFSIIYGLTQFSDNDVVTVMPSDHFITNGNILTKTIDNAIAECDDTHIIIYGCESDYISRNYGYILPGQAISGKNILNVDDFREKPGIDTALQLIDRGYLINAGMMTFRKCAFVSQLKALYPDGYEIFSRLSSGENVAAADIPNISVDKALLEHCDCLRMMHLNCDLHDISSFSSLYNALPHDEQSSAVVGNETNLLSIDSHSNLVLTDKRQIVTIGVDDLVIADTADALFVASRDRAEDVEQAVDILKQQNEMLVNVHKTAYRPWGSYTVLDCGDGYQVKQLTILPGKKISLQYHKHRSETWTVVHGVAEVIKGDEYLTLFRSESVFIPANTNHRLYNPLSKEPLTVIEVQTGDYLGEDDIIRIEDDFKRV